MKPLLALLAIIIIIIPLCGCILPDDEEKKSEYEDVEASAICTSNAIFVSNENSWDWRNVEMNLNVMFTYSIPKIEAGKTVIIPLVNFSKGYDRFTWNDCECEKLYIKCRDPDYEKRTWSGEVEGASNNGI